MRKWAVLFMFIISSLGVMAQPEQLFSEANSAYQQDQFEEAIALYDSIIESGYLHGETFYNLANTHFRLGNLGNAILNYERALKINPNDEDALHNLALANKQVVDEFNIVPTPALQRIFKDVSSILSSSAWTIIALVFFAFMSILLGYFIFSNRNSFILTLAGLSLIMALLLEGMAYGKYNLEQRQFAVLTALNSYVKSAPAESAQDLYILHEGTKFQVLDSFEGYSKIKLPDGKIGWIASLSISVI